MDRATAEKLGKVVGASVGAALEFDLEKTKSMIKTAKVINETRKKVSPVVIAAGAATILTAAGAAAFAVYKYILPDYLDDFEDDFEDDLDEDFFEDEPIR